VFPQKIHRYIFLFGLVSAPFGVLIGRAPGSWPIIILALNFVLEGQFKLKWQRLKANSIFWTLISLFAMYVLGLIYSQNISAGMNEFRIGLPLIILPVAVFSSERITKQELYWVLYSLLLGCFISSLWCLIYGFILHHIETGRELSRFMSHIRFGMYIDLSIASCIYLFSKAENTKQKILLLLLAIYFFLILFVLGLASGIVTLCILLLLALLYVIYKQKLLYKLLGFAGIVLLLFVSVNYVLSISQQQLEISKSEYNQLKSVNAEGQNLLHFDSLGLLENGNYVFRNIELTGLKKTWNNRVLEDTFNFDKEYNLKRYYVLLRYLTSAQLSKDAAGVNSLTNSDIQQIKKNVTNVNYPQWSFLHKRIYELVNEYDDFVNHRDVNGHSLAMRLIFWKASLEVISQHLWIGVGTGDVQDNLTAVYQKQFLQLSDKFYLKPHNQFLSITVAFGIIGLTAFLWLLFFPCIYLKKNTSHLYWVFMSILLISFLTEDTLGTQAGLDFYVIFNVVFLAEAYFKKQQIPVDLQANR